MLLGKALPPSNVSAAFVQQHRWITRPRTTSVRSTRYRLLTLPKARPRELRSHRIWTSSRRLYTFSLTSHKCTLLPVLDALPIPHSLSLLSWWILPEAHWLLNISSGTKVLVRMVEQENDAGHTPTNSPVASIPYPRLLTLKGQKSLIGLRWVRLQASRNGNKAAIHHLILL